MLTFGSLFAGIGGFDLGFERAAIGFDAEWHRIPSVAVGAVHERDRLWIIANTKDHSRIYESDDWKEAWRLSYHGAYGGAGSWDEAEPKVCRMDDGIPNRVDRTARLGNAIYPLIAEWIGRRIVEAFDK